METIGFLPGPVNLHEGVLLDAAAAPMHHRYSQFREMRDDCKLALMRMTNSAHAALMVGSGTLANEVVGAQLSLLGGRGLVISNGEFGERLAEQAQRFSLNFSHLKYAWAEAFNLEEIRLTLEVEKPDWIWFVHLETSTGVLNDMPRIAELCKASGCKMCVDVISSIGNMPINLEGAYLAAASSGKGLASISGVAVVFSSHTPKSDARLPKYLDLGFYYEQGETPFTFPSNLLRPLRGELKRTKLSERIGNTRAISELLKAALLDAGFTPVGSGENSVPFILTAKVPEGTDSGQMGDFFAERGALIHYKSSYLLERNWIQLALMGYPKKESAERFRKLLEAWTRKTN